MRLPTGWAAGAVGGVLQAIALALPGSALAAPLQLVALALLAAGVMGAAPRLAALRAGLHATVATVGTVWWLHISMHVYGGLPAWLSVLAVLALSAFLGSWCAVTMGLQAWLLRPRDAATVAPWRLAPGFVAAWLAYELARAQWFTGFPWGMSGYAHVDGLLALAAPWLGVYGMGALAAALAATLVLQLRSCLSWRRAGLVLAGLAASALPLATVDFTTPAGRIDVTLLQGNVAQDDKFDPARIPDSLAWHARSLLDAQGDLVVAPETALPLLPEDLPAGMLEGLAARFGTGRTRALIGVPLGDPVAGFSNSAIGLGGSPAAGAATLNGLSVPVYRYDKHHLVPFGEFIPWGFRWFVDLMNMPLGDFSRGRLDAAPFEVAGLRLAPNICYEDLFGEELAVRFRDSSQAPH
ncbi:MAG: apolipoprotein N-acyltransferase, partial [Pseudomonadota bacterium]